MKQIHTVDVLYHWVNFLMSPGPQRLPAAGPLSLNYMNPLWLRC